VIGVTSKTSATRVVALVAVAVLVTLSLGSVVAAGWQSGTDAVGELRSEPAGAMDRGDADESTPGERAGNGLAKRDGEDNETDRSEEADSLDESSERSEPEGEETTVTETETETTTHTTSRGETRGEEPTRASERATAGNATERNTSGAAAGSGADTPGATATDDRNRGAGPGHAALGSGLWIVGILGVLTTLFSLGGFVAAVMAYRGTD